MELKSVLRAASRIGAIPLAGVFIIGAAFGSALDAMHVWTGTTEYSIGPDRLPFWVPLEFGSVYLLGVLGITLLGSPRPDARSRSRALGEGAILSVVYAMTAILHRYEWLVVVLALAAILVRRKSFAEIARANLAPAIALVVGGTLVETTLISLGVFDYSVASMGHVPFWLPLLYANAVPFGVRLTETALWYSRVPERRAA